ncbi:MAG: DNA repair protein RecN [Acidobacteria bacterium]|nr:DNA repair protein RecN [Acidobacteriota bacterium]
MLHQLEVENYAVVEKLRIDFHCGLNLLTGETGSGKSILVDALSLLLGARASSDVIRAGAERARVAGVFELAGPQGPPPSERALLEAAGVDLEQGELLVEREILANGKTRPYINGRLITLTALRDLAPVLADIHGQHEQQDLFSPAAQLDMLDQFIGAADLRERLGENFAAWREAGRHLDELRRTEREKLRLLDLWKFQHQEITQAGMEPGEDARLEEEKRVLSNLARIQQAGGSAYEALYDSPSAAAAGVKAAVRALEELVRFATSLAAMAQGLETARIGIEETAFELRKYLDRLEANPGRLSQVEDRLALIEKLQRKYGPTIEQILAFGQQVAGQIAEMESSEETVRRIEQEQRRLAGEYQALAETLSRSRREGAERLEKPVARELATLAMERTRFLVDFQPAEPGTAGWTAQGVDRVRFLVSPNPGEPPRPLELVASGGEISRITLAIKTCLTGSGPRGRPAGDRRYPARTLVFDEIDAGIGGRAAEAVGRRLHRLSASHQLLCVTHLPQIAGFADHHYYVDKQVKAGRTITTVTELDENQRVQELARMLSGTQVTADAVRHARRLLEAGRGEARRT